MNNPIKKSKTYDADEMHDVQSLAASDMYWMQTALEQLRRKIIKLKKSLKEQCGVNEIYFDEIETLSSMYSYLAEERYRHHAEMSDVYKNKRKNEGADQ